MKEQVKSKQRVADHGEVFTAEREVNAMLDLVKNETERIDSRFLEPACGDGNFLVEILRRKLEVVKAKYKKSPCDYEQNAILALTSIYGVDILQDNVEACRERLFTIWDKEYTANCKNYADDVGREVAKYILSHNILCGNALSLVKVDSNGKDTDEPIIFAEWSFVTGPMLKRRDFRLDVLLREHDDDGMYEMQYSLFDDSPAGFENWMIDPITNEIIPKPIKEFNAIHYRRICENG